MVAPEPESHDYAAEAFLSCLGLTGVLNIQKWV